MENLNLPIIISAIVLLLFIVMIFVKKYSAEPHQTNYKTVFALGVIWVAIGISGTNTPLLVLGFIFMVFGLANRKKWKDQPRWSDLTPKRKRIKIMFLSVLTLALLGGIILYLLQG